MFAVTVVPELTKVFSFVTEMESPTYINIEEQIVQPKKSNVILGVQEIMKTGRNKHHSKKKRVKRKWKMWVNVIFVNIKLPQGKCNWNVFLYFLSEFF